MFAIIITEKGGTERREVFDKTEINVGRVQGNELMLPKGNVSKHHARLLFRDGRFIVTDLKSTNGTYVNGRKITQATIVREGDKIYIGDFIIKLEVPQQGQLPPPAGEASAPMAAPADQSAPGRVSAPGQQGPVSHYPLENDPDDGEPRPAPAPVRVPAPPRLPTTTHTREYSPVQASRPSPAGGMPVGSVTDPTGGARPMPGPQEPTHTSGAHLPPVPPHVAGPPPIPAAAHPGPPPLPPAAQAAMQEGGSTQPQHAPPAAAPQAPVRKPSIPVRASSPRTSTPVPGAVEAIRVPAHRLAVFTLVAHIEEMLDLSTLEYGAPPQEPLASRLERAIVEEAPKLKASGEVAPDIDLENLVRDAREELIGLGPLDSLMRDDDVLEIHVQSHATILSTRASGGRRAELPFASESACRRIVRRVCWQGGVAVHGDEAVIDRMLYGGVQILAVFEQMATTGTMATIRKRGPAPQSLEDLVRNGALSRAIATFLGQVVASRRNVLIAGPVGSGVGGLVGALCASIQPGERAIVIQEQGSSSPPIPNTSTLLVASPDRAHEVMAAACRLRPDRLIAPSLGTDTTASLLETVAGGAEGVVVGLRAPTLRQAVARLAGEHASTRGGPGLDASCGLIGGAFDLFVEFARLRDGRSRVIRVAEAAGVEQGNVALRDLFVFSVERVAAGGAVEGSFHPAGVVPRVAEELNARGASIEPGLFRR